jgi:hypothetical protein
MCYGWEVIDNKAYTQWLPSASPSRTTEINEINLECKNLFAQ